MAEPHLDHPGEIHWFSGYSPAPVLGGCPHDCAHNARSVIAWGPDMVRYELMECDAACDSTCRAWVDKRGAASTPWLQVAIPAGMRHGRVHG